VCILVIKTNQERNAVTMKCTCNDCMVEVEVEERGAGNLLASRVAVNTLHSAFARITVEEYSNSF